jgi:drug/metabolite transporter (DMT)-like permease
MYVALLFIPVLMWSFVGILVKSAAAVFAPEAIAFGRFAFGVVFLGLYLAVRRRKPVLALADKWIWIGAAAKAMNYATENIAMARGATWGYVVEQPVQAVAMVAIAMLYFRERPSKRQAAAVVLCVLGAGLFAVNGLAAAPGGPGTGAAPGGIPPADLLLFALAGIGAAVHFTAQKALAGRLASADMNFSTFLVASLLTALLLPVSGPLLAGPLTAGQSAAGAVARAGAAGAGAAAALAAPASWAAAAGGLVALGFVTGASFLIWAAAAAKVPFLVSGILANSLAVFALAWGVLLRHEVIGPWSAAGAAVFVAGLLLMNLGGRPKPAAAGPAALPPDPPARKGRN